MNSIDSSFHFVTGPKIIIYFIVYNRAQQKGQPDSSLGQPDFSVYQQVAHRAALWAVKACMFHDVVVKWKHFPRYWPFVRGIHQLLVNSPHKVLWLGTLMFSLICAWTNSWVNNRYAGDLRHHHAHYDFTVMPCPHVRMRLDLDMQFITIWMYSLYFISQVS